MKALVIVLNKVEYLDDLLSFFVELGISGATIIDSVGMGRVVSYNIPIFAGFKDLMAGSRPYNKTIFTLVKEEIISEVIEGIQKICGDFSEPGTGLIFTLSVNSVWGMKKNED